MNFKKAYDLTIIREGGYSYHMRDLGGETWKGVSRRNWPQWEGWEIIDQSRKNAGRYFPACLYYDAELEILTHQFYRNQFWDALNLDQIPDAEISSEIFDTAVNQGIRQSARYLQQALNMLNSNELHYPELKVDGSIGPKTLDAYNQFMLTARMPSRTKERNIKVLLKALNGLQFMRYVEIITNNEAQEVFFYGWVQRT